MAKISLEKILPISAADYLNQKKEMKAVYDHRESEGPVLSPEKVSYDMKGVHVSGVCNVEGLNKIILCSLANSVPTNTEVIVNYSVQIVRMQKENVGYTASGTALVIKE